MPRRKYKLNPAIVAAIEESLIGKELLGELLVALRVSDRAIEKIELCSEQIIELEMVRSGKDIYASLHDVQRWINTPEGKQWALPKYGRRA